MQRTKARAEGGDLERADSSDIHQLYGVFNIVNQLGLHARPAAMFVKAAQRYDCDIAINKVGEVKEVSGKSIMGMMTLELPYGSKMQVSVSGNGDSGRCLEDLKGLVASGFSEI